MNDDRIIIVVGKDTRHVQEIWQKLQLLAEEDIVLVAIESPDLVGIKAPDLPAMLGPDNRAGRRGHRHGKDYWKPQRPANNNSRK